MRLLTVLLGLIMMATQAMALTRTSDTYRITAEVNDAGGQRVTSSTVVIDGTLGGIVGISTNGGSTMAKQGYAGQLYDLVAIEASANPTSAVNEFATRQLEALGHFDDDSAGPLQSSPAWLVLGGPLASIDGAGLATAAGVFENTPASAGAVFGGYTGIVALLVVNTNLDDFGSYASDGIDDDWQVLFFGIGNTNAAPGQDPDMDGGDNTYEWITGTVPTNALSLFLMAIANVSGNPDQKDLLLDPTFADRTYEVEYATNLPAGVWQALQNFTLSTNGTELTVRHLDATNGVLYYRTQVTYTP